MKIHRTILPGEPGSKKLLEEFGKDLICVRYRYDKHSMQRIKTIELVVERKEWKPNKFRIPLNKIMSIRIEYGESEIASKVKSMGGIWNRKQKVWNLPFRYVQILGLEDRIVDSPFRRE